MATEKRLIDANGSYTLNATDNTGHILCFSGGIISVMDIRGCCVCEFFSDDTPTLDAVEVVHGRWVHHYYDSGEPIDDKLYCSECHMCNDHRRTWYCPNCGAKMDLQGE